MKHSVEQLYTKLSNLSTKSNTDGKIRSVLLVFPLNTLPLKNYEIKHKSNNNKQSKCLDNYNNQFSKNT